MSHYRNSCSVQGKVVFHGTRFDFDTFSTAQLGANVRNPTTSLGIYFTEDRDSAKRWSDYKGIATRTGVTQKIIEATLAISNPCKIGKDEFSYLLKSARQSTIDKKRQHAIASGHDGFEIEYEEPGTGRTETWWVVFNPEQISIIRVCKIDGAEHSPVPSRRGLGM